MPGRIEAMSLAALRPGPLRQALELERLDAIHFPLSVMLPRVERPPGGDDRARPVARRAPEFFGRAELAYRRVVYGWTVRRSRVVVAVSEHARQALIERYALAPDRVRTIYNAIDHAVFTPGSSPRGEFLLYPARPWPHKNHARLYEAFAQLRVIRPELRLVLTGEGPSARCRRRRGARPRLEGRARGSLPSRRGARLPVAVRRVRRSRPRSDGLRLSGGLLERGLAPRGRGRRGATLRSTRRRTTSPRPSTRCSTTRSPGSRAGSRGRRSSPGTRAPAPTTRSTASSPRADARDRAARAPRRRAARRAPRTRPPAPSRAARARGSDRRPARGAPPSRASATRRCGRTGASRGRHGRTRTRRAPRRCAARPVAMT